LFSLWQRHLIIALFLTMLTGTAGNAGNQSSAMVIRGLATGEINRRNGWKVIVRELKVRRRRPGVTALGVMMIASIPGRVLAISDGGERLDVMYVGWTCERGG
jgi:Mg/Co/Ni transporter MgtE